MVDIHSHILWGLDDGARDLAESLAMLELAAATGTTDIVATPHSDAQFSYAPRLVAARIAELSAAGCSAPRVHRGCDFHMSYDNISAALENPREFTINGLAYLLVEFADTSIPPFTEEILQQLLQRDIIPVVTHPERNPVLQESLDRLRAWIGMGCLMQLTAQSLAGRFGKPARQTAWTMLRHGLAHAVASDAHDLDDRTPRLDHARDILTEEMGANVASRLLVEIPAAVITGDTDWLRNAGPARPNKKRWFLFGR